VSSCSGTPISWLALELYQLGELPDDRRREVDAHLEGCELCRACLEQIQQDRSTLPALRLPAEGGERRRGWLWALAGAGLAAAAAAVLLVLLPPTAIPPAGDLPPARIGFKGGELALALVRERAGTIQHVPKTFAPGDRFKAEVTCSPAEGGLAAELVVFQGREVDFPLPPAAPLRCGNREPLAGAFGLAGPAPAVVCLVVQEGGRPPDREALRRTGPRGLPGGRAVCVKLTLAPTP
jgi:hypothetical protein